MATLSYRHNAPFRANKLSHELPMRLRELQQIHDVNYGLILSSVIITVALMALAWLVSMNSTQRTLLNPTNDLAQSYRYSTPAATSNVQLPR